MSGVKDYTVSVRQSQVNAWTAAANDANRAASNLEAMRRQNELLQEQQRRMQQQLQSRIDNTLSRLNESNRRLSELGEANATIRNQMLSLNADQTRERKELEQRLKKEADQRQAELSRRIQEQGVSIAAQMDDLSGQIADTRRYVDSEIGAQGRALTNLINQRVAESSVAMQQYVDRQNKELEGEMARIKSDFRAEIDRLDRRLTDVEVDVAVFNSERQAAINMARSNITAFDTLLEDIKATTDWERFGREKVEALEREFEMAQNNMQVNPAAGFAQINICVSRAMNVRTEIMIRQNRFEELRSRVVSVLSVLEASSTTEFMMPSAQEGCLFNLDEMSQGELAQFRNSLAEIRRVVDGDTTTIDDLIQALINIEPLKEQYRGITERAVFFECAAEETLAQGKRVVDVMVSQGLRMEILERLDNGTARIIASTRSTNNRITRILFDIIPVVGVDPKTGKPAPSYSYSYHVYEVDVNGNVCAELNGAVAHAVAQSIAAELGIRFNTQEGKENESDLDTTQLQESIAREQRRRAGRR